MTAEAHVPDERVSRIRDRVDELLAVSWSVETSWVRVHAGRWCPEPEAPTGDPDPVYGWQERCARCGGLLLPGGGQAFEPRTHLIKHPPLLLQLEQAVAGTTGPASSAGGFESKPAARLDAVDAVDAIRRGAARAVATLLGGTPSGTVGANLRALAARAHELGHGEARALDGRVLRWWARARATTGWDVPPWRPHVRCPVCDSLDSLRVVTGSQSAWCKECDAAWDASSIGVLGRHIRAAQTAAAQLAADVVDVAPSEAVGAGPSPWHCACHGRPHFPARLAAVCEAATAAGRSCLECELDVDDTPSPG